MENQQTTEIIITQQQPLNSPPESGNNGNSAEGTRDTRITKIKQKFLPGFKITLLLSLVIYIAMLVIGCLGVHHCPIEENIPLFLIVTGAIGLISKITTYMREHILRHFQVGYMESSFYTVEVVFLILGSYWVYKEYPPNYNEAAGTLYCQKTAYLFAFIYITIVWIIMAASLIAVLICCVCCMYCISTCCGDCDIEGQNDDEDESKKRRE